ncbi:TMhelix containing protein [Vibrio phage 1.276.O._10N.286.54.E4]|nr:TMhelix containing protein [Vibrio phage 1.276.O._10N.286.54.E4]
MKNVQMRINPELYAKFKLVAGESNNERMSKLLDDSHEKYALINESMNKTIIIKYWKRTGKSKDKTIKTLASALTVSIAVSVVCVGYVCMINGWLS